MNQLMVVVGEHTSGRMLRLVARAALLQPLWLLDGGNRANAYLLAQELRRVTNQPAVALAAIQISRVFTCHQMVTLLEEMRSRTTPGQPVLVLELTATFYDESVPFRESRRLFQNSLNCLLELSRRSPVVVSARPPATVCPERMVLLRQLCRSAAGVWQEAQPSVRTIIQPTLL
jgi:hypothetical protein